MIRNTYYDVIVVGAGIAGMTAAIYAARAGKTVLVLEKNMHGGQIVQTMDVANWPGEISVSGADLSQRIYHQMDRLGVQVWYDRVEKIWQSEEYVSVNDAEEGGRRLWNVKTNEGEFACGAIIIATGTSVRRMEIAREEMLTGRGVSYCATCDGALYKARKVAVVGGGNTALYDALYLSEMCEKVYLVHRREDFRGDKILVDKVRAHENVEFVTPYVPVEILGDRRVTGLKVASATEKAERTLEVDGIFVAVGRIPATEFLSGIVDIDAAGYVVAGEDCKTSAPGIFVAGDVRNKSVRQLVTAAGDGAVAATEACRYLD